MTDQTRALRDRIAEALYERERPPRDPHWPKTFASDRETFEAMADAVLAVLPEPADQATEIEQLREKHKASLRRADEINNELMAEVQRYADGTERPVLWSVYNRMHLRALEAEAEVKRLRRLAGETPATTEAPRRRCAHTDIVYGRCVLFLDDHDGECVHEHQPAAGARQDGAQS